MELALGHRLEWLRQAYGSTVVYCVDGAWDLTHLRAEGHAVRPYGECLSDHSIHVRGPADQEPFWRDHPVTAPLLVKRVYWPQPGRGVVELLDGGTPRENGITTRVLSRFEFVWRAPAWRLVGGTTESPGP